MKLNLKIQKDFIHYKENRQENLEMIRQVI